MSICPGCGLAVGPEATLSPGGLLHCDVCGRVFPMIPDASASRAPVAPTASAVREPMQLPLGQAAKSGGPLWLKLSVVRGPTAGRTIEVGGREIVFGRTLGDVQIADPEISRRHLAFLSVAGRCMVRDLGSSNGTFVDGVRVGEASVVAGQEVTLGETVLRLLDVRDAGPPR